MSGLRYLLPYDFSPLTLLSYMLVLGLYGVALLRMPENERPGPGRIVTFVLGVMLCYGVMQTRFDYYSQYMFFVHRGQHLILHHLGPVLIALSNPLPVMRFWYRQMSPSMRSWLRPIGWAYRVLQQPAIASILFVGLIFDPRSPAITNALGYGKRILLLALVAIPQMILGAWIVFSRGMVYDVYEVCGRAWPMPPETDQLLGGLLTWIPPAMMSIVGILIVLRRAMHEDGKFPKARSLAGGNA